MPAEQTLHDHDAWREQFVRFGIVGAIGFVANVSVLYAFRDLFGLYIGGGIAWLAAASATWLLNRVWTFKTSGSSWPPHKEWALFISANFAGFVLYYLTYVSLVTYSSMIAAWPIAAVFAGMIAGVAANFTLSRHFVFQRK